MVLRAVVHRGDSPHVIPRVGLVRRFHDELEHAFQAEGLAPPLAWRAEHTMSYLASWMKHAAEVLPDERSRPVL